MKHVYPLGIGLVALLGTLSAQADWEAKVMIRGPLAPMEGRIRVKKSMMRLDFEKPLKSSTVIDEKSGKAKVALHSQKNYLETDLNDSKTGVGTVCTMGDIDGCLAKQGYRKVGAEEVDGYSCDVYEGAKGRIWRPTKLKEVWAIKSVTQTPQGEVEMRVQDIKTARIDESAFALPRDYVKSAGAGMGTGAALEAMKNLSPEQRGQLLEMMLKKGVKPPGQ